MNFIEHLFINLSYENNSDTFNKFYSALAEEIKTCKKRYQFKVKTIYIATNDFLLFDSAQLIVLLNLIASLLDENLIEYTFEIGYQTLKQEQLAILKQFKINRLVWKVRTFNRKLLSNLNQKFDSLMMQKLIKSSFEYNYQNFSIDLENNIKQQTEKDIITDLQIALKLKASHISYQSHNDNHNYQSKAIITKFLKQHDYHNYEFFSFASHKKYYAQQTIAYLTLKNWYGFGPGANSFLKIDSKIITLCNSKKIPWTNKITKLNNFTYYQLLVTQNLLLRQGIFLEKSLLDQIKTFFPKIDNLISTRYLQIENNHLQVTNQGWVLLNDVLIDIINTKEEKERGK